MDLDLTEQIAVNLCASNPGWGEPKFIAAGNSAAVFEFTHPAHGPIAVKIYDPSFFSGDNALIEENRIHLQEKLRGHGNPHLIEILGVGKIPEAGTWFLLMELCAWKTLEDRLPNVPDTAVENLLHQLVDAVQFLEKLGLVHRDIKPANIAVSDDFSKLKLLDLGVMRHISYTEGNGTDGGERKRFIATAQYSSPEYLTREELPGETGFLAINIYQVGAVLHDLIMKKEIFAEEAATSNRYILYKAITTKRPLLVNPNLPTRLLTLCKIALDKDPTTRIDGVTLDNLASPIDSTEAIRKRLGARRQSAAANRAAPSIYVWRNTVRDWIAAAAQREKGSLGPFRLTSTDKGSTAAWVLSFSNESQSLTAELRPSTDSTHLQLTFSVKAPQDLTIPLLEIFETGPQMENEEVLSRISEHILYMVDISNSLESQT